MSETGQKCCTCEKCGTALEKTLSVVGGKWTVLILWNLYAQTRRFAELQRALPGISPKTLSARLQELEGAGVVLRTVYPEVPPKVEYRLTEKGYGLKDIFTALIRWSGNGTERGAEAGSAAPYDRGV